MANTHQRRDKLCSQQLRAHAIYARSELVHRLLFAATMNAPSWLLGLSLVLATGCVDERPDAPDDGDSGTTQPVDEQWLTGAQVMHIAADSTSLYYVADGVRLVRRSLAGTTDETLHTLTVENTYIEDLYLGDSDILFITETFDFTTSATERRLMRLPKSGGTPIQLASSQDVRAFLGVTVDATHVYFTTFTSLLRVPLDGGSVQFMGESPSSIRYWAFSPVLRDGEIYWAEGAGLYKIAPNDSDKEGTLVTSLPGTAEIIDATQGFIVAIAPPFGYLEPFEHFIEVDPTTGATGPMIAFGTKINEAVAGGDSVFGIAYDGVTQVPRSGGTPVKLTTKASFDAAATPDAVFIATDTGITRIALD